MLKLAKKAATKLGHRLGLWSLGFALYRLKTGKPMLVVFTFHRVTDLEKSRRYYMYYERGLDRDVFERQIDAITRFFHVADLDEFIDILKCRRQPRGHTALVTFDDADADFMEYALPYLKRCNLPTVMFTPTDFIESDSRFWHLRVSNVIRKLTPESWAVLQAQADCLPESVRPLILAEFPSDEDGKGRLARAINHHFNKENMKDVLGAIANWETILGGDFVLDIRCMNWNELRNLSCDSVYVESHSASHGKLGQLDSCTLEQEMLESKNKIEKELNKTVKAISYPGGSYSREVLEAASRAGYEIGFTTEYGFCKYPIDGTDIFRLPRYSLFGNSEVEIHYVLGRMAIKGALGMKL